MKIVVVSTTEGDDKPLKYPGMFRNASALIVNKIDLLPYVSCNIDTLKNNALRINPNLTIFETSCTSLAGIPAWCAWLEKNTHAS
jgi:hydrogenase nickel incorporation protein HypB